jgi:superfamily II DNA or RNA helicase
MSANPYDEFQKEAVDCIARDFSAKPNGRYLLVIPTGGGKTFTAVKSLHRLFDDQVLNLNLDRVLWIAHRNELITQAKDTFNFVDTDLGKEYIKRVRFEKIAKMEDALREDPSIRMLVIDEAHHAAAASYLPAFEFQNLGILGLTATPSRHDGKALEFERESFSIGFPDLVDRGIVLRPEVRSIQGGRYELSWDDGDDGLETLNNSQRNEKIIRGLLDHYQDYRKVVIFVGTKTHVTDLYDAIRKSKLANLYNSIGWITGEGNSRSLSRDKFIEEEKAKTSSILINIDVLSEGYDDPTLNTVIMARPTKSKLVYMQSMGRAIRHNPNDLAKKAYIVEVVDELPNIRYRIDNRWLYADISDSLEPAVRDEVYSSGAQFVHMLASLYDEYSVPDSLRNVPEYDEQARYSILLFKRYVSQGVYRHLPILIDRSNRLAVSNMFNFLSERMAGWLASEAYADAVFSMLGRDSSVTDKTHRKTIYQAMCNAVPPEKRGKGGAEGIPLFVRDGQPWITFISLRHRPGGDEDLESLTADMVNREEILAVIRSVEGAPESHLIRLPLPLRHSLGKFLGLEDFKTLENIIARLEEIASRTDLVDHYFEVKNLMEGEKLPLEARYLQSLITITRENTPLGLKIEHRTP